MRNSYDPTGRLIRVEQGSLAAWQSEAVQPALWPGFQLERRIDFEYDALDRKTREWVSNGASVLTVTEYGYDRRGLLVCTAVRMNPLHWSTPLADKCVPGPVDPAHGSDRITKNFYDAAGQLTEVWDGVGTPLARREAHYTYNGNGQKLSLTDARGFKAEMHYDGHGRQSRWVFPSKTTPGVADASDYEQYGYDPNGNRTSLRKRDGQVIGFAHDALNRVTLKTVPMFGLNVRYSYDLRGLQTSAWFTGTGWSVSNAYDGFGRLTSTTSNMGGPSRTVSHRYDREGRRIELTFPNGQKFWSARDGLGRAIDDYQGEHGVKSTIMTAFAYDPAGRRSYFARRFGDMTAYSYDAAGRLNLQIDGGFAGGTGDTRSDYVHNPANQLHTESRTNDAYAWTGSVAASRSYETNGQNQYKASGAATFDYDANGNLTSTVNAPWSTTYAYDVENRLVSASGTHNATLTYDPLGRLFQISSPSGTTQFLYDGDELIAEYDAYGNLLRRYIHGDGSDDPIYWYEGAGFDQPRFPHSNHQGSITAITGLGSALLAINTYDEYGIPGKQTGRFGYTGQAWMPELGLWYYKARFYSPYMGRFLQVDPIGYDDQVNLYAYVGNDPVNARDPSGMVRCSDDARCGAVHEAAKEARAAAEGASAAVRSLAGALKSGAQLNEAQATTLASFEKKFGAGSASRSNLNAVAGRLDRIAAKIGAEGSGMRIRFKADIGNAIANAPLGGNRINIGPAFFSNPSVSQYKTIFHEAGHGAGLDDQPLPSSAPAGIGRFALGAVRGYGVQATDWLGRHAPDIARNNNDSYRCFAIIACGGP